MSISDNFCSSCTDMIAEEMACAAEEIRVLEIRRGNRTTQVPVIQHCKSGIEGIWLQPFL